MAARFRGKTVLITGAARGQGASHARAFVSEGANVVLADNRDRDGVALAEELGRKAVFFKLDVTIPSNWEAVIEEVRTRLPPVSILVNNAGELAPAKSIVDSDPADWDRVVDTNLKGMYLGIRGVAPLIKQAGGGAIVNIASSSGHVGTPDLAPYVASKWGVRGLTETAAMELARAGIRVNSVSPGVVDTPMITEPLRPGEVPVSDHFSAEPFAVPRMAEPWEITKLVMFLVSEDAAFVTGADFIIDGGMLLGPVLPPGN